MNWPQIKPAVLHLLLMARFFSKIWHFYCGTYCCNNMDLMMEHETLPEYISLFQPCFLDLNYGRHWVCFLYVLTLKLHQQQKLALVLLVSLASSSWVCLWCSSSRYMSLPSLSSGSIVVLIATSIVEAGVPGGALWLRTLLWKLQDSKRQKWQNWKLHQPYFCLLQGIVAQVLAQTLVATVTDWYDEHLLPVRTKYQVPRQLLYKQGWQRHQQHTFHQPHWQPNGLIIIMHH